MLKLNNNISIIIIIITCIISLLAMNNENLRNKLIFYPYSMNKNKNEWYKFITHGFIHADFVHLGFNMYTLYSFGEYCETLIFKNNKLLFLGFYLAAIVASSIYDYSKNKNNPNYAALGASGAVSAVIFAMLILDPWESMVAIFGVLPLPNLLFAALYLGGSYYLAKKGNSNIGHMAHFWGAIFGFVIAAFLNPLIFASFIDKLKHLPF